MDTNINKNKDDLQSWIITTGVSSLNHYIEHMKSFEKSNSLLYNLMRVSRINNIEKVEAYKIIIDFCDTNTNEIVLELLNYLLSLNVQIHVKVINNEALASDDANQCMILLNRLNKNELIKLEIFNELLELQQEKEMNSWIEKLKSIFFYPNLGNASVKQY